MIAKHVKQYCNEDICLIENYDKAINDTTQTWHCHHRLEIELNKSIKELIDLGLYYDRPASELKFLTKSEHHKLHSANISEESKRKNREAHIGKTTWMKDKKHSAKSKQKMRESSNGQTPWNKGKTNCYSLKGKTPPNKGRHRVYNDDGTYYYE